MFGYCRFVCCLNEMPISKNGSHCIFWSYILIDLTRRHNLISYCPMYIYKWVSFRENEPSLYISLYESYKNDSRLNRYNFGTINVMLTSYFQHIILHQFYMVKGIVGACSYFLPVLQRKILLGIQIRHRFRQENSIWYICRVPFDLSCSLIFTFPVTKI